MKKKRKILLSTILLILIGFASITTTIVLNGSIKITINEDYKIIFTRAIIDEIDVSNTTIQENATKIIFNTKELSNVGDKSILNFTVTNTSRNYDADIEIKCAGKEHTDYYKITSSFIDIIKAGTSEKGTITIELIKVSVEDIESEFTCTLNTKAVERDSLSQDIEYKEKLLANTTPIISGNLVPITLDDDGTVHYADTSKEWYSYEKQKWANAIILIDNPSQHYQKEDIIKESDIESYFVWIPKYKYKLWNIETTNTNAKSHTIDIIFTNENTEDKEGISCKTPMTSGNTGNCNNGEYMTHPAFISLDVTGFWVGKYETGYKGAKDNATSQINDNDTSKIIIQPNAYSWRDNTVKNFFEMSYNYKRELDSHMMKNTEWGAVAYLSHSNYGKGSELGYNNTAFQTGYIMGNAYNTSIGREGTTSGNITGIYDTSGGSYEYMASHLEDNYGTSGFDSINSTIYDNKYFDLYNKNSNSSTFQNRILGDATGEMGPFVRYGLDYAGNWYHDYSTFLEANHPWFQRGAATSEGKYDGGNFYFSKHTGSTDYRMGFRIVLSP